MSHDIEEALLNNLAREVMPCCFAGWAGKTPYCGIHSDANDIIIMSGSSIREFCCHDRVICWQPEGYRKGWALRCHSRFQATLR